MASFQSSSPFHSPQALSEVPRPCANPGQPWTPKGPDHETPAVLNRPGLAPSPCRCAGGGHTRLLRLLHDLDAKYGPPRTPTSSLYLIRNSATEGTAQ
jgi:hypothetical protein